MVNIDLKLDSDVEGISDHVEKTIDRLNHVLNYVLIRKQVEIAHPHLTYYVI